MLRPTISLKFKIETSFSIKNIDIEVGL
jgi:hypothetical protein